MPEYRYNLLLSIRLSRIPWLEDPRTALNDEATSVLISEHVLAPNVRQQARNEEEDQYRNEARSCPDARSFSSSVWELRNALFLAADFSFLLKFILVLY